MKMPQDLQDKLINKIIEFLTALEPLERELMLYETDMIKISKDEYYALKGYYGKVYAENTYKSDLVLSPENHRYNVYVINFILNDEQKSYIADKVPRLDNLIRQKAFKFHDIHAINALHAQEARLKDYSD